MGGPAATEYLKQHRLVFTVRERPVSSCGLQQADDDAVLLKKYYISVILLHKYMA